MRPGKPVYLVFGASIGKNTSNIFKVIENNEHVQAVFGVEDREHPRLLKLEQLEQLFSKYRDERSSRQSE